MYELKLSGVYIEITSICNRNCPYCYNDSTTAGRMIEKDSLFRVFNECKHLGISTVTLSGGEPFIHPDIDEILFELETLDMKAVIITNLSLVSDYNAANLARRGHVFQITFDASDEYENDLTRGTGSYSLNIKLLERFKAEGLIDNVILRYNVNKRNHNEVEQVINLARNYGIKAIDVALLFKSGRGCNYEHVFDYKMDLREIAIIMPYFRILKEKYQAELSINYTRLDDQLGCVLFGDGELSIGPKIESNGDVYICQLFSGMENTLGNIYESTLKTILNSDSARKVVDSIRKRKQIQSECRNCVFTEVCMCGCPAVSYNQTGSLHNKDDQCEMIKFFLKERVKQIEDDNKYTNIGEST